MSFNSKTFALVMILNVCCFSLFAEGALRPDKVRVADSQKTQAYLSDGLVTGGDRAVDDVVVRDIRRATNAGYERVVIDLEGNRNGNSAAIQRAPYYQVAVSPEEKRIVFTLWGKPKLNFDSRKVLKTFKRSGLIGSLEMYPRVDDETWSFVINLKKGASAEIFELADPVRVIVDIRANPRK